MALIIRKILPGAGRTLVLTALFVFIGFPPPSYSQGQKATTIAIHDVTSAANGGAGATSNLTSAFKSALEREKPCVETVDDQDIRDAIQDERERAMIEGGDSTAALALIGSRLNAGYVMVVRATPGAGGSTLYSGSAVDPRTARMVANDVGTGDAGANQVAESLVRQLGPYLADNCRPHWIGSIKYVSEFNETKEKNDAGAMRTASRNTKRKQSENSNMTTTIKATLRPPAQGNSVNTPQAQVSQRTNFVYTKSSSTSGELYCRLPGKNPIYKGFSESYSETTTQRGQGTDVLPVFITIDDDGEYSVSVSAPGGVLLGKFETMRRASNCDETEPSPSIEAIEMPEGRFMGTSFEFKGRASGKNPTSLAGSQNSPDGRTKITWNLRLVKPKGKQ